MTEQISLFDEAAAPTPSVPLKEPVDYTANVLRETEKAVSLFLRGQEIWVPKKHIRISGLGMQRITIEKFKAEELNL